MKNKSIWLIDSSHLLHRMAYTPLAKLDDSKGRPSGLIHGFLNSLISIRENKNNRLNIGSEPSFVACWDKSGSKVRDEMTKGSYKANRYSDTTDEDRRFYSKYSSARSHLINILGLLGIPTISVHGVEADDIIAYLSRLDFDGKQKVILSEDSDLFQLIKADTSQYKPIAKKWVDQSDLIKRYGEDYNQRIVKISAMCGTHNNVTGIKGIGEKSAIKILDKLDSDEELPVNKKSELFKKHQHIYKKNLEIVDILKVVENYNLDSQIKKELLSSLVTSSTPSSFLDIMTVLADFELAQVAKKVNTILGSGSNFSGVKF